MKTGIVFLIAFFIVCAGYMLFLVIGMSSTYPSIRKYSFNVNKGYFEQLLVDRILSSPGWSLEKRDSVKWENETCYGTSLTYETNGHNLEYLVRYCFDSDKLVESVQCMRMEVVMVVDYIRRSSSHELSDKDVDKLLEVLEGAILNKLAPPCARDS